MTELKATEEDVRYAYRLLLGREPDPSGRALYTKLVASDGLSPAELAGYFLQSEEFIVRSGGQADSVKIPFDGYVLLVNPVDRDIGAAIVAGHSYEPYVETVVREVLKEGDTFVDVGANIGYFTALAAHLVGPSGHVAAWEPLDKNVQLIYATIWENRFGNVAVYPFAASSSIGLVAMTSSPTGSNAGIAPRSLGERRTRVLSQTQRLDDILRGLKRVDLIKFDIEGHEAFAWQGATELLKKHRPRVLTEFHPKCILENTGEEPADYLALLLQYCPRIEVLHRHRDRVICKDVHSVLQEWQKADDHAAMNGSMHIDLYLNPSSP